MSTNIVHYAISNPAVSFLLHDCVKSKHNQIGFLFGEIHRKVSDVTSDSHSNNECIEITVSITASLPVEDLFFSMEGTLNKVILDTVLGEYKEDVVGWYSFTRNQDLSPSIYQLFLAHQLCDYFSHIPSHLFLYFRISTNVVFGQNFTYTNKFLCTTGHDTSTPVELHIRQLGESTHAYNAHKPVTSHSEIFDSVLNTIEWKRTNMVTSFEILQDLLSTKIIEHIDQQNIDPNQLSQENQSMRETARDYSVKYQDNSEDVSIRTPLSASSGLPGKKSNRGLSPAPKGMRNRPRIQSPMRTVSPANARPGAVPRGGRVVATAVPQTNPVSLRGQREAQSNNSGTGGRKSPGQIGKQLRVLPRKTTLKPDSHDKEKLSGRTINSQPNSNSQQGLSDGDSNMLSPDLSCSQTLSNSENELDKSASTYSSQEF